MNPNSTRNLRIRYIIGLSVIATLTIIAQVLIQAQIFSQQADANVINIAGRQRMLSQRLSKEALLLREENTPEARQQLEGTLELWTTSHNGLQFGNESLDLPGENSETIRELYAVIQPHFEAMGVAANCLTEVDTCAQTSDVYITQILEHENDFLRGMNRIVFQYADEANENDTRLQIIEVMLATATLIVLVLEAFLIFRPAERHIQQTLDQLHDAQYQLKTANDRLETHVQERTRQLWSSNNQLQQANHDMLTFTRMFSHDLKSPVASMKGFVGELELDWNTLKPHLDHLNGHGTEETEFIINESIPDALAAMNTSSQHLENLLKSIGKISRDGQRQLELKQVDVNAVVNNILDQRRRQIQTNNADVTVESLPTVHADQLFIERIFDNLISNAIKYRKPDRPNRISISAKEEPDLVTYYVQDTGIGIAEEDRDTVFQLFQRGSNIGEDTDGEGLGMYVIRNIVHRHGGSIDFESTPGQGSTFYFKIPKQFAGEQHG